MSVFPLVAATLVCFGAGCKQRNFSEGAGVQSESASLLPNPSLTYTCELDVPNGSWPDNGGPRVDRFAFVPKKDGKGVWNSFVNRSPNGLGEPNPLKVENVAATRCPGLFSNDENCASLELVDATPVDGKPRWSFKIDLAKDQASTATLLRVFIKDYLSQGPDAEWIQFGSGKKGTCTKSATGGTTNEPTNSFEWPAGPFVLPSEHASAQWLNPKLNQKEIFRGLYKTIMPLQAVLTADGEWGVVQVNDVAYSIKKVAGLRSPDAVGEYRLAGGTPDTFEVSNEIIIQLFRRGDIREIKTLHLFDQ